MTKSEFGGFNGMLKFFQFLNEQHVQFKIEQQRDDAVMISFALIRHRIEIEFFDDHIEYSIFQGSEDVLDDEHYLVDLVKKLSR